MSARRYGLGKGAVYPAAQARHILLPARHAMHPPRRLARRTVVRPDAAVLELGCGPGWFSPALADRVPQGRLHLADLQPDMLRMARERAPSATATAVDALALPSATTSSTWSCWRPSSARSRTRAPRWTRSPACCVRPDAWSSSRRAPTPTSRPSTTCALALGAGLHPRERYGRLAGYTAVFGRG